jgi:hypothetical protein
MPTVGWIAEGNEEQFLAARDPLPARFEPIRPICPICGFACETSLALNDHLSSMHPLDRPRLLLDGREAPGFLEVFVPLQAGSVKVMHSGRIGIKSDARVTREVSLLNLRKELAGARRARIEICLENQRKEDGARTSARYDLRFDILDFESLGRIDRSFLQILSNASFGASDIVQFVDACSREVDATRYYDALANYAYGVLIKDFDGSIGSPQSEYQNKFKAALHVLVSLSRGLSNAIKTCIRLSLNQFGGGNPDTGIFELDSTMEIFEHLSRSYSQPPTTRPLIELKKKEPMRQILPVDQTTAAILELAQIRPGPTDREHAFFSRVQDLLNKPRLTVQDTTKLNALFAYYALLVGRKSDAVKSFHELSNDANFGAWSENQLRNLGAR